MNDETLELELSKARDYLDRAYVRRGRLLGDLSDADLRDAYVRGTLKWFKDRTDCRLLEDAGSELRLRRLEPPYEQAGSAMLASLSSS